MYTGRDYGNSSGSTWSPWRYNQYRNNRESQTIKTLCEAEKQEDQDLEYSTFIEGRKERPPSIKHHLSLEHGKDSECNGDNPRSASAT